MLRTRTITTIGVVALALAVAPAAGAQQDLRSPDARDAAATAEAGQDLRSPDARDAAAAAGAGQDLRSPDARDAARPSVPTQAIDPAAPFDRARDGFGWGDAGIGAAGMLGIVLAFAGIGLLTVHQRRRESMAVARH